MIKDIIENIKDKYNKPIYELIEHNNKLEQELSILKSEIAGADVIIAEFEGKVAFRKQECLNLQKNHSKELKTLKSEIANLIKINSSLTEIVTNLNAKNSELAAENKELKTENLTVINSRPIHNERGAGRKSRITPEIRRIIKDLKSQNLTQTEIAKKLTASTGEHWSRSTIGHVLSKIEKY